MGKQNISKRPLETIKFRGFNAKNGKWIYGFYLQNRGDHFVCPDEFANGKSWKDYEVIPETVGQYTGKKDENGKEIWEGDIVKTSYQELGYIFYDMCEWRIKSKKDIFHVRYSKMVVIGNIHDNPELLKEKKEKNL